jgi:hypothetical protein
MTQNRLLNALLARSMSHAEIRNVNAGLLHTFEIKKDEIAFLLILLVTILFPLLGLVFLHVAFVFQVYDLATNVTFFLSSTYVKLGSIGTYTLSTSRAQSQKLTSTFLLCTLYLQMLLVTCRADKRAQTSKAMHSFLSFVLTGGRDQTSRAFRSTMFVLLSIVIAIVTVLTIITVP